MNLEPLGGDHLDDLLPFVQEYHALEGIHMPETARRRAVARLLGNSGDTIRNSPRLAVGHPSRSELRIVSPEFPIWALDTADGWIGYLVLTYGFSIEFRGRDAFIDEFFIRPPYRGRGLGTRALAQVKDRAAELGLVAVHLEVARGNRAARKLYGGLGFELRDRLSLWGPRPIGTGNACGLEPIHARILDVCRV